MHSFRRFGCHLALLPIVPLCLCSLPSDVKPVRWNMDLELPVTDQRFLARDLLPAKAIPALELSFNRTGETADTVKILKTDSLHYTIEKQLVSTDTAITEEELGTRPLEKTPPVNSFFAIPTGAGPGTAPVQLPSALLLNQANDQPLDGIQFVTIDESSIPLQITVANVSQQAEMNDVKVFLIDRGDTIGRLPVGNIPPGGAPVVKPLSLAGKTIHSPITVAVTTVVPANSTVYHGDGLQVSFTLDGQSISEAMVADSMIDYSDEFTGSFKIADSINLDLIDLDDALLRCEVSNPSLLMVGLKGVINDAWNYDFARSHNLNIKSDLNSVTDSSGFAGSIINDTVSKSKTVSSQTFTMPLKNMRLFPTWDTDSGKSILHYRYLVRSISDGRWINFNKNDKFVFKLIPARFPFIRIKGKFIQPTVQSFSSNQEIGFGWKESIIDSLKKSFRFESAIISFDLLPELPENSSLDSLLLEIMVKNKDYVDSVKIDKKITAIRKGTKESIGAELAGILNTWPDSIGFNARIKLPSGTGIDLYNEKEPDGSFKSTLSIGVAVKYSISIPFSWHIVDTIRTELEQSSFSPGLDDLEWISKISNPSVRLNLRALNNTNLHIALHAIGAGEAYRTELNAFNKDRIGTDGLDASLGDRLFSLFGDSGISLAPRGDSSSATIAFDQRGIDALLSKKKCLIRWFLVIPASGADAFKSTDYIDLDATATIRGTGNSDSLLYEDR